MQKCGPNALLLVEKKKAKHECNNEAACINNSIHRSHIKRDLVVRPKSNLSWIFVKEKKKNDHRGTFNFHLQLVFLQAMRPSPIFFFSHPYFISLYSVAGTFINELKNEQNRVIYVALLYTDSSIY